MAFTIEIKFIAAPFCYSESLAYIFSRETLAFFVENMHYFIYSYIKKGNYIVKDDVYFLIIDKGCFSGLSFLSPSSFSFGGHKTCLFE